MATPFRIPETPDYAGFARQNAMLDLSPINNAIGGWQQQEQRNVENKRAEDQLGMQRTRLGMEQEKFGREAEDAKAHRFGKTMAALAQQPPEVVARVAPQLFAKHPEYVAMFEQNGIPTNDHPTAVKMLAQAYGDYDPLAQKEKLAKIGATNANAAQSYAQAQFYKSRANAVAPQPQPSPPAVDPLAGAGLDENGAIIPSRAGQGEPAQLSVPSVPDFVPSARPQGRMQFPGTMVHAGNNADALMRDPMVRSSDTSAAGRFSPPMRLGGPIDDIERSMRLDEGRPQGVQVAQAGGSTPAVPGIRPELMNQAMGRFGRTGMTSPEVPGMVTDAGRNRRVDVPATREMQGQRAFDQANPEQQNRLMKFRTDQELWTGVYKRPPRAGYYYGEDGREMALTDKNFKGDKEAQAVALMNWNKIESASKQLLDTGYVTRTVAGAANLGDTGQAFADMKQGALGIAYALSGKTVAVAEMKNFIEAYGPVPGDGDKRIRDKTERMKQFYSALLTASRGGAAYETAFARAMAATGIKNPDGSAVGEPAAAGAGTPQRPPANGGGLSTMSTEDLIMRLNGGR